jgi:polar amino acid transport system permease protein
MAAIINNLIQLLLGTSLLSAIALPELTGTATVINARTLLYIQTFSVVALVYLLLSNLFPGSGTCWEAACFIRNWSLR